MPLQQSQPLQEPKPSPTKQPSLLQDILALLIKIFIILTVLMLIFTFLFGFFSTKDMSMKPAVQDGDIIFFYRLNSDYIASDLLVLDYEGQKQVRRVIAVSGDTVDITQDGLYINNARIAELSTQEILLYENGPAFPLTVPEGHVFVLADNMDRAIDSRIYGTIPIEDIMGKVTTVIRQRNL